MNGELTDKQKAFVEHYLACWNASEAARRAGYSVKTARQIGQQNLSKLDIQAAIRERLDALQMTSDEVLVLLTTQARASIEQFIDVDEKGNWGLDLKKAKDAGALGCVKKLKPTRYGTALELYDAQGALALLGKAHGLFVDRQEIQVQGNLEHQIVPIRDHIAPTNAEPLDGE